MFTCSEDIKETLELWSEEEGRTVSNLVERIIAEAIAARAKKLKSSKSKVQDEE
ncbi:MULTISPECIES: hypothetical protein [unclassified Nostoc]|jgi:hypothetical protein|nr:hypothetical protein [Nostoc sp. WHI]